MKIKSVLFCAIALLLVAWTLLPALAESNASANFSAYSTGSLTFSERTAGSDAAFDGNNSTAFAGSITGMFAKRSVLSGITIRAGKKIRNLRVLGSENGDTWVELYSAEKLNTVKIFGYDGSDQYTNEALEGMYTYALRYLRVEIAYGSIAEIILRGYEVDVEGTVAPLDTSYGNGGYLSTPSYYTANNSSFYGAERTNCIFNHLIGTADQGEAFIYDSDAQQNAFVSAKFTLSAPMTAIALCHKSGDANTNRWNGMLVEVSADGNQWDTVYTFPETASSTVNFRQRTVMLLSLQGENQYQYVRLTSAGKSAVSLASVDVYSALTDSPIVPGNILSGWAGDPYLGENAPAETTEKRAETTAPAVTDQTPSTVTNNAESGKKKSGGCKGMVGTECILLLVPVVPFFIRKRKK